MTELPLEEPVHVRWHKPKAKSGCGRDPAAGPGTCYYWWEGCPRAKDRGCYQLWAQAHEHADTEVTT